uniref:EF-hand domain-containing protein n=1 Tax=Xenopus tropicalis TaxID=8364 RepID=A0A6I8RMX0_XENTR
MAINLEQMAMHLNVIFKKYAGKDGDCSSLNQNELCEMALKEFPHLCVSTLAPETCGSSFSLSCMDMDGDKKVTFEEFALFFAFISIALHG